MNKITYEIGVRIPLRKLLKPIEEVEDSINKTMEGFGFREKLVLTSVVPLVLEVGMEPTAEQMRDIEALTLAEFSKQFGYATIEYNRRKL